MEYGEFLDARLHANTDAGFAAVWIPDFLFDFQRHLVEWSVRKGRAAIFADCGMGKTAMELVWAENVARYTGGRVLILTPLAVAHQTVTEAEKFGIEASRSMQGEVTGRIVVTNYERLHLFNPSDFVGVVCDESSILKNFDGVRRNDITVFMRKMRYRLLATATAAPNDYTELGTSSEALGYMGYMDMLNRFFKNDLNNSATGRIGGQVIKWRFKGHAERPFWRWVCSWARAVRKPSDIGFDDARFTLPPLVEDEHVVAASVLAEGMLFALPAVGLQEQREERRRTIADRCAIVADLVSSHKRPTTVWCHLNEEGDLLSRLIPDAVQVSGKDSDDEKERKFLAFVLGDIRVLVTKPKIGAWGLNFQHCADIVTFASHSFEQYYQSVRRSWRYGQQSSVRVSVVVSDGERGVLDNLRRKQQQADRMFNNLVKEMQNELSVTRTDRHHAKQEIPQWL